jgi:Phage integrase, N-terminal SAM-like domain
MCTWRKPERNAWSAAVSSGSMPSLGGRSRSSALLDLAATASAREASRSAVRRIRGERRRSTPGDGVSDHGSIAVTWWCVVAFVERCGNVWRAHWVSADGRHRGSRSGFATKREAKHFADVREVGQREAATGLDEPHVADEPNGQMVTVGAWWERWFPVQDLAPTTLEAYTQQYRHHIAPRFADVPIGEVTGLDLSGFVRGLRERDLAPSSVTAVMSVLRDLLGDAAAEGVISAAPKMPGRGRTRHARWGHDFTRRERRIGSLDSYPLVFQVLMSARRAGRWWR